VCCRCDRHTRQNLDRPSTQFVEDSTPPSLQSTLLVRPVPEPVVRRGKDPRLRCQDERQRTPAVPAVRVVEVPLRVGAEQRANVVETLRAALCTSLIGVQSLHGTVLSFQHNHCNQQEEEGETTPARRRSIGLVVGLDPVVLRTATRHTAVTRSRQCCNRGDSEDPQCPSRTLDFWPMSGVGRGRVVLSRIVAQLGTVARSSISASRRLANGPKLVQMLASKDTFGRRRVQ
jgi:hypothetical protein